MDAYHDVDDIALVPIHPLTQPKATKTIELEVIFDTMDDGTNHGTFNYVVYNPQEVPAVLSEMTLGANATVAQAYGPATFVLDSMDVVDLVVKNADAGKHPLYVFFFHYNQVSVQVLINFTIAICTGINPCSLGDHWITRPMTQHLTHQLSKAERIPCVVTPFKFLPWVLLP